MDADAYLRKQGWKGAGHALDRQGRGIKKPLLIAHKRDQLGLGKKKAAHSVDDQWWMRAFDESLQNIGTGQESTLSQIRTKGINRGGLYGFFVKGEGLAGTISSTEGSSAAEVSSSSAAPSGTSTPPTSASDNENALESSEDGGGTPDSPKMPNKRNKRKRGHEEDGMASKKLKVGQQFAVSGIEHVSLTKTTPFGALDAEQITKINSVMRLIRRQVLATIKSNTKKGVYGPCISQKEVEGRKKSEAQQPFDDPNKPGEQIKHKTAKTQRRKAMRDIKKDVTMEHVVAAIMKGDLPNPEGWTKDEAVANYRRIESALSGVEKAGMRIRREAKKSQKQIKREAAAEQSRFDKECRQAEKKGKKRVDLAKQPSDVSKPISLTPGKKAKYQKRAAEKNQTLEEYVLRRMKKKEAKRAGKESQKEARV